MYSLVLKHARGGTIQCPCGNRVGMKEWRKEHLYCSNSQDGCEVMDTQDAMFEAFHETECGKFPRKGGKKIDAVIQSVHDHTRWLKDHKQVEQVDEEEKIQWPTEWLVFRELAHVCLVILTMVKWPNNPRHRQQGKNRNNHI